MAVEIDAIQNGKSIGWADALLARLAAGSISTPKLTIAGGTITTDLPMIDASVTWNAGGVTFVGVDIAVTDTASATASRLVKLSVGGSTQLSVNKEGSIGIGTDTFGTLGGIDWPGRQINIADDTQAGLGLTTNGGYAAHFLVDQAASANNKAFTIDVRQGQETFRIASVLDDGNLKETCVTCTTSGYVGIHDATSPVTPLHVAGAHVANKGVGYFVSSDAAYVGVDSAAGSASGVLLNENASVKWIIYRPADNSLVIGEGVSGTARITLAASNGTSFADSQINMASLPTANPSVAGRLWNDNGTVKVSAG